MEGSQIWKSVHSCYGNHVNNANHPDSESTLNRGSGDNSNRTLQDRSIEVGFRIQNLKNRNCQLDIVCHVKKVDDNQNNINAVQSQSNNSNSSNQNVANNSENNNIIQSQGSNSQQRNNDQTICLGKISDVLKKRIISFPKVRSRKMLSTK